MKLVQFKLFLFILLLSLFTFMIVYFVFSLFLELGINKRKFKSFNFC